MAKKGKTKPWSAKKFKSCETQVVSKGKITSPKAVCASVMWGKGKKAKKKK